ncbi:MAG: hypothetical protein A3J97_05655 [Spirochaetes bacterium RIFOXYC1_FULL_54_7]|nr:MAG: hypothetical protein A3J97_05655 [Spirochaetes bacterium RIFOXYC1_FULL_54_7]
MASNNDKNTKQDSGTTAKRHSNPFVYFGTVAILVITIIAFVLVPSLGGGAGDSKGLNFGSWDNKPIAFAQGSYFATQVQATKDQLEQQGYRDTGDQFFAFQVWRQAFENTATHFGLLDYATSNGISASDEFLDKQMARYPAFIEDGVFSRRKFSEASNAFKLSVRQEIKETTLKQRYVGDVVSVETSSAEKSFIKAMAQYERSLEFAAFPFEAYPDSERLAFATKNQDKFRRIKLSKVTLTSTAKEAEEVLARIRSGALSFEEAARNHSKDAFASKGGDMGWQYTWEIRSDLKDPALADELLALPAAEVSKVYETVAGSWAFYRIDEAAVAAEPASVDLLRTVTDYMNRFERGSIEDWNLAQAKDFAAGATADFAAAASARNLTVKETNAFPLNYGGAFNLGYFALLESLDTQSNPELSGANTNETFLKAIFSLEAGQVSEPVILDNAVIVARVLEIRSADESTLGLIEAYYPSIVQDGLGKELTSSILQSPKLKDDFFTAFSQAFSSGD